MSNFTFDEVYHIMSTHWTNFEKHFVWELRGADLLGPALLDQERALQDRAEVPAGSGKLTKLEVAS